MVNEQGSSPILIAVPELPEIEHLRRTLEPWVVGARVLGVHLWRRGVVRVAGSRRARRGVVVRDLLEGDVIRDIARRGKSLAFVGEGGGVLVAHMGMTGSMRVECEEIRGQGSEISGQRSGRTSANNGRRSATELAPMPVRDKHVHCEWVMERGTERLRDAETKWAAGTLSPRLSVSPSLPVRFRLLFRDPRRFGGLWPFESMDDLLSPESGGWSRLGPDAFDPPLDAKAMRERLLRTSQPMKAALLNQGLIAGVGNIYADEALFAARIHPRRKPATLERAEWPRLAKALRRVLERAVAAGGSSIRDYVDAAGEDGLFALQHQVYGRGGEPCVRCGERLRSVTLAQRTTVFCVRCQER
jgi:formamidopyrimidine-DNA glycosylase